jgi:hypothetical protein
MSIVYHDVTNETLIAVNNELFKVTIDSNSVVTVHGNGFAPGLSANVNLIPLDDYYALLGEDFKGKIIRTVDHDTNLTEDNFIGISDGLYADSETATIRVVGAMDNTQSGLIMGSKYYVQRDGTLSTDPDLPKVFAGTALSTTNLLIKG